MAAHLYQVEGIVLKVITVTLEFWARILKIIRKIKHFCSNMIIACKTKIKIIKIMIIKTILQTHKSQSPTMKKTAMTTATTAHKSKTTKTFNSHHKY